MTPTTNTGRADGPVQLIIWRLDTSGPSRGCLGEELVAFQDEEQAGVYEAGQAWATVRGYERTLLALYDMFAGDPPESGWHMTFHKPHQLVLLARWPWAPAPVQAL